MRPPLPHPRPPWQSKHFEADKNNTLAAPRRACKSPRHVFKKSERYINSWRPPQEPFWHISCVPPFELRSCESASNQTWRRSATATFQVALRTPPLCDPKVRDTALACDVDNVCNVNFVCVKTLIFLTCPCNTWASFKSDSKTIQALLPVSGQRRHCLLKTRVEHTQDSEVISSLWETSSGPVLGRQWR